MKLLRILSFMMFLVLVPFAGYSQSGASGISENSALLILGGFVLLIAVLVLIVSIIVWQVLKTIVRQEEEKKAAAQGITLEPEKTFWDRFHQTTTDAVPIEEEETILLDHNYDGIQELDNHLPPWWKWMFYISIVFAVVYIFVYHVVDVFPLPEEEYRLDMARAEAARAEYLANQPTAEIDENSVAMVDDAAAISAGKQVFDNNCAQCHRADGGGGIGPNLTDDYWLHGGSIQDIFNTIKVGVPAKGMISWEPLLTPEQMQNVASYILTLGGTNPPDAKAPEGELYTPGETPAEPEAETDSTESVDVID